MEENVLTVKQGRAATPVRTATYTRSLFIGLFAVLTTGTMAVYLQGSQAYAMFIAMVGTTCILLLHMVPGYAEQLSLRGSGTS